MAKLRIIQGYLVSRKELFELWKLMTPEQLTYTRNGRIYDFPSYQEFEDDALEYKERKDLVTGKVITKDLSAPSNSYYRIENYAKNHDFFEAENLREYFNKWLNQETKLWLSNQDLKYSVDDWKNDIAPNEKQLDFIMFEHFENTVEWRDHMEGCFEFLSFNGLNAFTWDGCDINAHHQFVIGKKLIEVTPKEMENIIHTFKTVIIEKPSHPIFNDKELENFIIPDSCACNW